VWSVCLNNPIFLGDRVLDSGIYFPAGDGKSAFATRADMGEASAAHLSARVACGNSG
jgi:NAD(P)H dehydrogenase (quinone)